ncbi:MAG: translation initiation factor IF-3 [Desulfobacca sp. 4484_104]|nr:MAG: translation initiation factor IF-3 [Desulfobacca sp. 4484_104]RLA88706.1 MAG: translation initiation factor IF-3 [Deltaproteobacteria bacterium]
MIQKKVNINREITAPEVRLVGSDGSQIGIMPISEALERAAAEHLDLVEVAPQATPPVCRIMDYGKFKYMQSKKTQEARKKQATIQIKEVKVRPKIEEHDIAFKLRNIRRFLTQKDKTKVSLVFRGREIAHPELGYNLLKKIAAAVEDIGVVEQQPKFEGRHMTMVLAPK